MKKTRRRFCAKRVVWISPRRAFRFGFRNYRRYDFLHRRIYSCRAFKQPNDDVRTPLRPCGPSLRFMSTTRLYSRHYNAGTTRSIIPSVGDRLKRTVRNLRRRRPIGHAWHRRIRNDTRSRCSFGRVRVAPVERDNTPHTHTHNPRSIFITRSGPKRGEKAVKTFCVRLVFWDDRKISSVVYERLFVFSFFFV